MREPPAVCVDTKTSYARGIVRIGINGSTKCVDLSNDLSLVFYVL